MLRAALIISLTFAVTSCGLFGKRTAGSRASSDSAQPFKAKLQKGEGRAFAVSVVHKGSGVAELRESVRFEATKYCLLGFGASDAAWAINPANNDWAFVQDGDRLIFNGECTAL